MRTSLKIIGGLLAVLMLLAGAWVANVGYFKPYSIDLFFERVFIRYALKDPELLSRLRLLEPLGINYHNSRLTDVAPEHDIELGRFNREQLETLHAYDRGSLTRQQQLSYDILDWYLTTQVEGEPWMFHNYPANPLFGVQNDLPTFMVTIHQINDAEDARDYIARLGKFGWKFDRLLEGLRLRESKGILPPRFVVEKVLAETRGFIGGPPEQNILYTHFQDAVDKLADLPPAQHDALLADAKKSVSESVYPAYRKLIAYFETLAPKATANNGVWVLPDGDRYYTWEVRRHTTTQLTPEEVHRIGLAEVERIEAEMDRILRRQGYTQGTVGARIARLNTDERFLYPDTDAGRAQVIADFQAILNEIDRGLDPYFDLRPKVGVTVERIPQFREKTAPAAYYQQPPLDESRPGTFYANLRNPHEIAKWSMRTLAYHEAIPGHHFQIAIAQEMRGVPTFRKVLPFTAYIEGWALYAERLAKEIGYENDPYDDLGRLRDEMFRACRLVVDTGLHQQHWAREQAIDYMLDKTGMPEAEIVAEVERYLVLPGQALAYKIGQLKILELREQARQALGPKFDIKRFHHGVLGAGAMPLTVLQQEMERSLEEQR